MKYSMRLTCFIFLLTSCDEYLNLRPILSFQTFPQQQPIDLIKASSVSLSAQATSCTFNKKYSVHDYSGFQSRWRTFSNRFFSLSMTSGNGKVNLNVRAADCHSQWFTVIPKCGLALILFHSIFSNVLVKDVLLAVVLCGYASSHLFLGLPMFSRDLADIEWHSSEVRITPCSRRQLQTIWLTSP